MAEKRIDRAVRQRLEKRRLTEVDGTVANVLVMNKDEIFEMLVSNTRPVAENAAYIISLIEEGAKHTAGCAKVIVTIRTRRSNYELLKYITDSILFSDGNGIIKL